MWEGSGSGMSTSAIALSGPLSSVIWIARTGRDPKRTPPRAPGWPGPGHGDLGDGLRLDRDRVERTHHRGQGVSRIQEGGVHAHRKALADALGGADQLELEAEIAGVLQVVGLDVLDPLEGHLVQVD